MHMADALVSPAVAGTMYAASIAIAGVSVNKVRLEDDFNTKKVNLINLKFLSKKLIEKSIIN